MTSNRSAAQVSAADTKARARSILSTRSAFQSCSAELIDEIMKNTVVVRLARGDIVYRQGEKGDSMMVVVSGSLKVTKLTAEGKELVLGFVRPGALIGEIAALDGKERTANVTSLEATEAVTIYRRDLLPILRKNADAMFALLDGLCDRLRTTNDLLESYTMESSARVAACLVRLAGTHGQAAKDGVEIDLKLTQRDLGSHLGLTRETISRTLGDFRDEGLISLAGQTIVVHNREDLALIAEGSPD